MTDHSSRYPALSGLGASNLVGSDRRVVIVGASGWLGMAALEGLRRLLGARFYDRVVCFGSSARTLELRGGARVDQAPLAQLASLAPAPSCVLHLAFLTQEKAKAMADAEYIIANKAISAAVLDVLDLIDARAVFIPSSGAAYLVDDERASASMRLYGGLKIEDEALFADWARRGARRCVIARVFNLAGPYINKQSSYALACFIADALACRPIAIKASHPVYRSFVSVTELMSVVLGLLSDESTGVTRFDTAGDHNLEMGEIADIVRAEVAPRQTIARAPMTSDIADRYCGDGAAYRGFRDRLDVERVEFPEQVRQTARFMASADAASSVGG